MAQFQATIGLRRMRNEEKKKYNNITVNVIQLEHNNNK